MSWLLLPQPVPDRTLFFFFSSILVYCIDISSPASVFLLCAYSPPATLLSVAAHALSFRSLHAFDMYSTQAIYTAACPWCPVNFFCCTFKFDQHVLMRSFFGICRWQRFVSVISTSRFSTLVSILPIALSRTCQWGVTPPRTKPHCLRRSSLGHHAVASTRYALLLVCGDSK